MKPAIEEQKRIIAKHGPKLTLEALKEMDILQRNIQEAIRLHPPLILLLRQVHKDFTVTTSKGKTFKVPKVPKFKSSIYTIEHMIFLNHIDIN